MAQLFSKGKIRQEVGAVAGLDIARAVAIVQQLHAEWKNGNADDETRYEQSFNQLFFNELLGYGWQTHMHPKAGTPVWGKIADLGLWLFREEKYNFDDVQVVVELKGAKIFLDKKQNRQNPQSPVDQWFGYKTSFTRCKWLIVSNFHQIRLYRDNKQDYQEWTLAELVDGQDNNRFALRSLLVLLSAKHLLSTDGESHTEKLMSQFRMDQQKITKKFYQHYKWLRLDLINDIRYNNPGLDIEIVVEKSQKIIDRLVFTHFCEDQGLLPADKLKENIVRAHEAWFTPWEILRKFFVLVDKGSESLWNVGGYNWELFKPDTVLDSLHIGDVICRKFIDLGDYDFSDELSVNILGHIFEQSISDLEQLKIDLLGTELETDQLVENKKQSKRKKDGIFYTPEYIVDYIVQNSLMKYLSEKEDECLAKYKDEKKAYQAYQQILQNVKVLDPACGSGAFLVRVFDELLKENKRVWEIIGRLSAMEMIFWKDILHDLYKNILTNNIYGVDLNPESVEITKLSLWLKSAQKGKKLNNLDGNIKCGNSLIDDESVAGERAFDWHKEFKGIMDGGWFDVIVGNPPYVLSRDWRFENEKKYMAQNFKLIYEKANLYLLFIEKSDALLKKWGYLWFIVPNSRLGMDSGMKIREYLLLNANIQRIVNLQWESFPGVNVETVIFTYRKDINKEKTGYTNINSMYILESSLNFIDQKTWLKNRNFIINILSSNKDEHQLLSKIDKNKKLSLYYDVKVGLQAYEKWKWTPKQTAQDVKNHIFDYDHKFNENTHKYFGWWDVCRYVHDWSGQWLSHWEWLSQPKELRQFSEKRILIREITSHFPKVLNATYIEETFLNNKSILNILEKSEKYKLKYLLTILNSTLISFYHTRLAVKGNRTLFPKVVIKDVQNYPIPEVPVQIQQPFIDKADQMLALNKEFHEKKSSALALIQAEYRIEKVNRKLEHFWELDFADFLKALGIKSLSLDKKEELMGWFGKKKEELSTLKNTIDQVDKEIDGMVYTLYWLSDEEIAIVEWK
jgi:type I restriction-modification system DNA methylase subunit